MENKIAMSGERKENLGPPYPRPPILECVLELRFADSAGPKFVDRISRRIGSNYETTKIEQLVNVQVEIIDGGVSTNSSDPKPLTRMTTNDEADICSVDADKIFWARLAPYEGWEPFEARFERDISDAARDLGGRRVKRIGLRYQNRIDVPVEGDERLCHHENYLTARLSLPALLEPTNGFEWMIAKVFPDLGLSANIRSGSIEPVIPGMGAFLLDIDVAMEVDQLFSKLDLRAHLRKMRELKNEIFESSISDLARETFK